jgi:hypothetical protein
MSLSKHADASYPTPSRHALAELARVVGSHSPSRLLKPDTDAAEELHDAARLLADEARGRDPVRAERLLIGLRGAWRALPEVRRLADRQTDAALWDRLTMLCVEEFYAPASYELRIVPPADLPVARGLERRSEVR